MTPIEPLRWSVHPFQRNRKTAVVMVLLVVSLVTGVYLQFGDMFLSELTAAILIGSLRTYFFPLRYELNERAAVRQDLFLTSRMEWDRVFEIRDLPQGIQLIGGRKRMLLPCEDDMRESVNIFVSNRSSPVAGSSGTQGTGEQTAPSG